MNYFIINLMLSMAWVGLTGEFTPVNFIIGFLMGYLILGWVERGKKSSDYFRKIPLVVRFAIFFFRAVVKSNFRVMFEVLTPHQRMKPGIVAIPLDARTDLEITVLANLITLTPGTLSLDISEDRKYLFVHAMFIDDVEGFKKKIKQELEKRLMEVMR
ncbi:MAG: Na+/H+ antiporter subunit E [Desulfobacteraceae bacterium]|nr:Na+/H+ antiporter subunit E [Desulfobacteraceae bacterium]